MMKYLINLTNFDCILSPLLQQIICIFHKSRYRSVREKLNIIPREKYFIYFNSITYQNSKLHFSYLNFLMKLRTVLPEIKERK